MPRGPQKHSDDDDVEGEEDVYHDDEDSQDAKPQLKPIMRPITTAPSVSSASGNATPNTPGNESPCGIIIPGENTPEVQPPEEQRPKIGLSLKLGESGSELRRQRDSCPQCFSSVPEKQTVVFFFFFSRCHQQSQPAQRW